MHELSIAMNIIEIAENEMRNNQAVSINKMEIDVGKLSGVIIEALEFALNSSKQNTILSDTEIIINELPARVKCVECSNEFETEDYFSVCPKCQSFRTDVIAGKELQVRSMVLS